MKIPRTSYSPKQHSPSTRQSKSLKIWKPPLKSQRSSVEFAGPALVPCRLCTHLAVAPRRVVTAGVGTTILVSTNFATLCGKVGQLDNTESGNGNGNGKRSRIYVLVLLLKCLLLVCHNHPRPPSDVLPQLLNHCNPQTSSVIKITHYQILPWPQCMHLSTTMDFRTWGIFSQHALHLL